MLNNKMTNVCKGVCIKYKAVGYKGKHRYNIGQKRCPVCEEFLKYLGIRCPCCSVKLRTTPRGNKARKEIQSERNCVWY
ncbi:hypothetical protein [Nitrosopumilus adriaticus]|uniref:Uncharacterized protein n=2 Tax=Nitrosopumilus TaxID=338191 RepID=A0A0D5C0S0_9ARCH|nr:hypothetical protein [Nitrosopumilus adriaticus]AJW69920.1 hypothetical protein NADRNF5_0221 [Nitrosopumilus adriaticus]